MTSWGLLTVVWLLLLLWAGVQAACPHELEQLLSWSDAATWEKGVPKAGDTVTIPADKHILFDVSSTPKLRGVDIHGLLVFNDPKTASSFELKAEYVLVHEGGRLQIGSGCCPYKSTATISLFTPKDTSENLATAGTKVLGVVEGGTIEIHGDVRRPSWTVLSQTAAAGQKTIVVADAVQWKVGDVVVLATTDFTYDGNEQSEKMTIASIGKDKKTIELTENLKYPHFGEIVHDVDERGEVGLLTRNIIVRDGDPETSNGFGAHIIALGDFRAAHFTGVEIINGGQKGLMGRYPIHFHMAGQKSGRASAQDLSIHDSYQRCLTVHGTHSVVVSRNVAFNTFGHCYFIEDGIETNNTLEYNLGILAHPVKSSDAKQLLPSDDDPSVFWITNPDNTFRHNHAVSGRFGFWYALPVHPTGPSATDKVFPRKTPLKEFSFNHAHSNTRDGLFVDLGPDENGVPNGGAYDPQDLSDLETADEKPVLAVFSGSTLWKNSNRGAWLRNGLVKVKDSFIADNAIGITMATVTRHSTVENSVIVGETHNVGVPVPWQIFKDRSLPQPWEENFPIRGFEFYDGPVSLVNAKFWGFFPSVLRDASALSMLRQDQFSIATTNDLTGVQLMESGQPMVYFADNVHDGDRNCVFRDLDGSVTGHAPSGGKTAVVTVENRFLMTPDCISKPEWKAHICPDHYGSLSINNEDVGNTWFPTTDLDYIASLYRDDLKAYPQNMCGSGYSCPWSEDKAKVEYYWSSVIVKRDYTLHFKHSAPPRLSLNLLYVDQYANKATEDFNYITVGTCYPPGTIIKSVRYNWKDDPEPATSLDAMKNAVYNNDWETRGDGMWFHDTSSGYIYVKMVPYEERTKANMKDAWPATDFWVDVTIPEEYKTKAAVCTIPDKSEISGPKTLPGETGLPTQDPLIKPKDPYSRGDDGNTCDPNEERELSDWINGGSRSVLGGLVLVSAIILALV